MPLARLHWEEVGHFKDIPLEPDYVAYCSMQDAGILRVYTARNDEKQLLGYSVFVIYINPHSKSSLTANQDLIFIHPDHRGFGRNFIDWCDAQLKAEGVQVVYKHIKAAHNFGQMLETMDYELVDLLYARRLD